MSCSAAPKIFLIAITLVSIWTTVASTNPFVKTKHSGTYVGESRDYFDAYEGIRYAKAPVGPLRFEPPVSFDPNPNETFVSKKPAPFCLQWNLAKFDGDLLEGEEDCLFLNVYVPHRPESSTVKLPVIFHIHGGAFKFGSGTLYGPKYLTQQGMILVNIQYRLGVLGFLSSGDTLVPGNMGFKDQSLALKWVHDNIESFGGDPNRITIAGWSAGAGSSHAHMFSPLSRGLFASGISHSGTATSHWAIPENVTQKFNYITSGIICDKQNQHEVLACLKSKKAEDIVRKAAEMYTYLWFPGVSFALVVEPPSDHAFITDTPLNLLKKGDFANVPWLASVTEDDGLWFTATFVRNNSSKILEDINERWNEVAPLMFDYYWIESPEKQLTISQKIRKHYFGDQTINRANLKLLTKAFTDRYFRHGIAVAAKYQRKLNVYSFNFPLQYGFGGFLSNSENATDLGISHGDDLLLIYDNLLRKDKQFNDAEQKMSDLLIKMYKVISSDEYETFYFFFCFIN